MLQVLKGQRTKRCEIKSRNTFIIGIRKPFQNLKPNAEIDNLEIKTF